MQDLIYNALRHSIGRMAQEKSLEFNSEQLRKIAAELRLEKPPRPELGDWGCPCFPLAKVLRQAPPPLALALAEKLRQQLEGWKIEAVGPYLNFHLPRAETAAHIMRQIASPNFGCSEDLKGQKIMVEFSAPNTNKPLHLGHLRNNVLGESISRILAACGAQVNKVNLINDRGVHICKSMLAYQRFGCKDGTWETPENSGIKGDHLVGKYYVLFNDWSKELRDAPQKNGQVEAEQQALKMLKEWEEGEPEVYELWQKMRRWVLDGIAQTYRRCDISFDRLYYESDTYKLGKELVDKGLEQGIFTLREDGAVFIDLSDYKLDQKVVQRSDGTSVYITQDLGTAVARHEDFAFDRQIYVVGNEQDYHFKVLFRILRQFAYPWSEHLYHLSYGMVVLPDGKMKSREGTVVDADVLLDQLEDLAAEGLGERSGELADREVAGKIALAALHFYLLQFNPQRDISFDPKESLAFTGNTGPYLQYVGARVYSILKKAGVGAELSAASLADYGPEVWGQLGEPEWELLKQLRDYPEAVRLAAEELNPSHVIKALFEVGR
ncbi:MAG: arginine--tRNA ligase, partial [Spirochaetota bacterium]